MGHAHGSTGVFGHVVASGDWIPTNVFLNVFSNVEQEWPRDHGETAAYTSKLFLEFPELQRKAFGWQSQVYLQNLQNACHLTFP